MGAATGGTLKNLAIFTGKHLCWSLFLSCISSIGVSFLLKGDSNAGVFL